MSYSDIGWSVAPLHDNLDDDDGNWIDCWQCGGEGVLDSCMEDTCVCVDPPCCTNRCDICKGAGGWVPKPDPLMSAVLGDALAAQGSEPQTGALAGRQPSLASASPGPSPQSQPLPEKDAGR